MQTGSRGEVRTMLLALKLLEMRVLEAARDTKPMLLLDDVFSELDGARRRALTEHLKDHQTFITTTDADIVVHHFLDNCTVIPTTGSSR
jgi:DNA replication and repair protein RecF